MRIVELVLDKETFGQTLKKIRKARGISQERLADLAGIDRAYVNRLELDKAGGGTMRTAQKLADVLRVKPDIFFSGGEMEEIPPKSLDSILSQLDEALGMLDMIEIPVRGNVPAGYPEAVHEEGGRYVSVPRDLLGAARERKDLFGLIITGSSLEGDNIYDGDTVIVEPDTTIIDGKIYVVRLEHEVCARHLYRINPDLSRPGSGQAGLKLVSSNGHYNELEPEQVEILGRIILSGRWQKH